MTTKSANRAERSPDSAGDDYRYVKMEISFEEKGMLLGQPGLVMDTFTAFEQVPGQIYSEGQGMFMLEAGEGAIFNCHGAPR